LHQRLKITIERWIEEAKLSHLKGKLELSKVLLYVLASRVLSEADKKEYATLILEELGLESSELISNALQGNFDILEAYVINYMHEIQEKIRRTEEKLESLKLVEESISSPQRESEEEPLGS